MIRRLNRDRIDRPLPDQRAIRHDAMRYLRAQEFLRHMYKSNVLTLDEKKRIRARALSGDVDGAMRELGDIVLERG